MSYDEVIAADGTRVSVRVAGPRGAPAIVLVHGWAQSAEAFAGVLDRAELTRRFRVVAMDLRGHGRSDVPDGGYDDPRAWAGDLAAVLEFAGTPAVVLGWSYGGLVLTDYVRTHGTAGLAGLVLTGAITEIGRGRPGGVVGSAMRTALPDALSDDPAVAVPALSGLTAGMAETIPGALAQRLLGTSLAVPPAVRAALFRRDVDSAEVLASIDVPTLILHGTADAVVDPNVAHYAFGKIQGASMRWMDGVAHLPFVEASEEFTSILREFAENRLGPTD